MSSTPRSKPMPASPRASKPAAPAGADAKKPKAKKPKASSAPSAPMTVAKPEDPASMNEELAKEELKSLNAKYGALVVAFNDQQESLRYAQEALERLESENEKLKSAISDGESSIESVLKEQLSRSMEDLRAAETQTLALQKKVNQLQVEHVSEEEVDQLFLSLEAKDKQLEEAKAEKETLEDELLTARQMSARGTAGGVPQVVEIHHHNDLSDDDDDDAKEPTAEEPAA